MTEQALIALNATAGVAALGGMVYALGGAPDVPPGWLERSPFRDYEVPGLILGGVYAPTSLAAAWAVAHRHPHAPDFAILAATVQGSASRRARRHRQPAPLVSRLPTPWVAAVPVVALQREVRWAILGSNQ